MIRWNITKLVSYTKALATMGSLGRLSLALLLFVLVVVSAADDPSLADGGIIDPKPSPKPIPKPDPKPMPKPNPKPITPAKPEPRPTPDPDTKPNPKPTPVMPKPKPHPEPSKPKPPVHSGDAGSDKENPKPDPQQIGRAHV